MSEKSLEVGDTIQVPAGTIIKFRGMSLLAIVDTYLRIEALDYHDPPAGTALGDGAKDTTPIQPHAPGRPQGPD